MTETSQKVIALLSEALTLERLQSANSPAALHICTALNTFGKVGQDEIRKANAARANRAPKSTQKPSAAEGPRTWHPGETPGKPTGLPEREVIQSSLGQPIWPTASPAPESPRRANLSVPVAETENEFADLTTATEIPKRPTKVLDMFGIDQIKIYLGVDGVEIPDGANDKEIAALLIQHFNTKA